MSNEQKYSVMTVKDMLWKVLGAWKLVVILAVLGLVVGAWYSGRAYSSNKAKYDEYCESLGYSPEDETKLLKASDAEQKAFADKRAENWKMMLSGSQLNAVNGCISTEELMSSTKNYMENAIYMNVNPYNIDFLSVVYQLSSGDNAVAIKAAQNLNSYASGGNLLDAVAAGLGWKDTDVIYSDLLSSQIVNSTQLKITFFCDNADNLAKAETLIDLELKTKSSDLNKQLGAFTIESIESSKTKKTDLNVANGQNTVQSKMQSYNTMVTSYNNSFKNSYTQMNYHNYLADILDGGNGFVKALVDEKEESVAKPSQNRMLFAIVGFLTGVVLAVIIVLCGLLASGKLLKSDELVTIFGLPYLGALVSSKSVFVVDKLIKKLTFMSDGPYDKELRCSLMADRVAGIVDAEGLDGITIVGTEMGKGSKKSIESLAEKLKERKVKVNAIGNMMTEQEASQQAVQGACVLVMETVGKSSYKSIEKELSMLEGCGVKVIGAGCVE